MKERKPLSFVDIHSPVKHMSSCMLEHISPTSFFFRMVPLHPDACSYLGAVRLLALVALFEFETTLVFHSKSFSN